MLHLMIIKEIPCYIQITYTISDLDKRPAKFQKDPEVLHSHNWTQFVTDCQTDMGENNLSPKQFGHRSGPSVPIFRLKIWILIV